VTRLTTVHGSETTTTKLLQHSDGGEDHSSNHKLVHIGK
jgi:hypothetical protein